MARNSQGEQNPGEFKRLEKRGEKGGELEKLTQEDSIMIKFKSLQNP